MSRYWSKVVHGLTPYVPGEQPKLVNLIKLNTNESPYGPSRKVLDALRAEVGDTLRLYPDPCSDKLRAAIAKRHGLAPEQVFVGNGSDEVLAQVFQALLKHAAPVLFPDVTYSFYPVYCALYGIAYEQVPLNAAFAIDVGDYARPNGGIVFPNPNAPTGQLVPIAEIERLLEANTSSVVVIDEAYVDFAESEGASSIPLISRLANLVVLRTFSKSYSLAGMRIGLALASDEIISGMMKVKDSYNVNRLSMIAATAALQDLAWMNRNVRRIQRGRKKLMTALRRLGYSVYPSHANFVLARKIGQNLKGVYEELKRRKILVRYFDAPGLQDCLRITVGTPREIQVLLKEMAAIDD